ncbi:hypothetical protein M3Y97_00760700 [Aphelenchoides bicaudatus]|nr:hypothetical protein M3Y97_00760700 [Aphelenchoides bicaudatus]
MDKKKQPPVRLAIHQLTKETGMSKGKATLEVVKKYQEQAASASTTPQNKQKEKEVTNIKDMPYYPPMIRLPLTAEGKVPTSILTAEQQRRYVAIISNYLKPEMDVRFETNKLEIKGFDEMLMQEREHFETECMKAVAETANPYDYLSNQSRPLLKSRVSKRISCLPVESFQEVVYSVDWLFYDQTTSGRQCRPVVSTILNQGQLPQILLPNPRRNCRLSNKSDFITKRVFSQEYVQIESDENAVDLAVSNDLQFIMCASTLRSLLVMPWVYRDQSFSYKLSVRQKAHNGRFVRYFIISKPIMSSAISKPALQHKFLKWMVKASVANEKVVTPSVDAEVKIEDKTEEVKMEEVKTEEVKMEDVEMEPAKNSCIDDLLGDILEGMGGLDNLDNTSKEANSGTTGSIFDKRYLIVDLATEFAPRHRVLVRSTNHGTDQLGNEVCLTVKTEYIPAIGAEKICEEELLWNHFTGIFKAAKVMVNLRMHAATGNVLQIQRTNVSQGLSFYGRRKPISQRTERLSDLFDQIKQLDVGEYLLMQADERMEIISQTICDGEEKIWGVSQFTEASVDAKILPLKPARELWKGINFHLPLVWHIVQGRVPGALPPIKARSDFKSKPKQNFKRKQNFTPKFKNAPKFKKEK